MLRALTDGMTQPRLPRPSETPEWPTILLILGVTGLWCGATALAGTAPWAPWLAWPLVVLCIALHSSLQHEVLHGHPTPSAALNEALVFPAIGLFIPYRRFRDSHLAHHVDERLTDPYDDPESNYLAPAAWARLPSALRLLLTANNTLAGRILLGPAISLACFLHGDIRAALAGDRGVLRAWALHGAALVPVALWLGAVGTIPWPAYLALAYLGLGILKIRTFLEHRAHLAARGRSVIIEDRGPLAFVFLNNNLHAVHHGHPALAWYKLPELYESRRARYLQMNDGYVYRSYMDIFRRHLFRRKDPVAHPLHPLEE